MSQLNIECGSVKRLKRICEALKLRPKCPFWLDDCVAHIGIPSKKAVISHRSFSERHRTEVARERWGEHGYEVLAITAAAIERFTDAELAAHLKAALKGSK